MFTLRFWPRSCRCGADDSTPPSCSVLVTHWSQNDDFSPLKKKKFICCISRSWLEFDLQRDQFLHAGDAIYTLYAFVAFIQAIALVTVSSYKIHFHETVDGLFDETFSTQITRGTNLEHCVGHLEASSVCSPGDSSAAQPWQSQHSTE